MAGAPASVGGSTLLSTTAAVSVLEEHELSSEPMTQSNGEEVDPDEEEPESNDMEDG